MGAVGAGGGSGQPGGGPSSGHTTMSTTVPQGGGIGGSTPSYSSSNLFTSSSPFSSSSSSSSSSLEEGIKPGEGFLSEVSSEKTVQGVPFNIFTSQGQGVKETVPASELRYTCEVCGKSFRFQDALNVHRGVAHGSEKRDVPMEGEVSGSPSRTTQRRKDVVVAPKSFEELLRASPSSSTGGEDKIRSQVASGETPKQSKPEVEVLPHPFCRPLLPYPIPRHPSVPESAIIHLTPASGSFSVFIASCVAPLGMGYYFESRVGFFSIRLRNASSSFSSSLPTFTSPSSPCLSPSSDALEEADEVLHVLCLDGSLGFASEYLSHSGLTEGSTVLVAGCLRLLPFVEEGQTVLQYIPVLQVAPPLGTVQVLDQK